MVASSSTCTLTSALTGLQKKSASPTRRKGAIITGE
jgi:hypothetical protein